VNPQGIVHVTGQGAAGKHTCYLQATTSLTPPNWTTIGAIVTRPDGSFTVNDPDASNYSSRFYRTMTCD
jgi:hypothetical protein